MRIKKQFIYLILMSAAAFLGIFKVMAYGLILSPKEMGYFSMAMTITSYGMLLQFGIMNGLNRELTVRLGAGQKRLAGRLVGEATIALCAVEFAGLIAYYLFIFYFKFSDADMKKAFLLAGLTAVSATFAQIVFLRLRAEQRVLQFAATQFYNALSLLIIGFFASRFFSFYGAVFTHIFVNTVIFFIASRKILSPVGYRRFKLKNILYLMRIGFPLMAGSVLFNLQLTMDRLFLINAVSPQTLGIYQIAVWPLTMGIVLNGIVEQYVGTALLFKHGQGKPLNEIFKSMVKISAVIIIFLTVMWIPSKFFLTYIFDNYLIRYKESLVILPIFYIGAVFTAANMETVINAANRQMLSFYMHIFVVAICFISYIILSLNHLPVQYYAYTNVAGQILSFLLLIFVTYKISRGKPEKVGDKKYQTPIAPMNSLLSGNDGNIENEIKRGTM
ncbi:polysaccharide biosynthesis protein [Candidatus Omnitrophus magneticus]|uniref:Polysaccharide biosynthesis protein n=1 Tax=Candidatus Omnitrophus magneticus TaxID=1609969 RepID=A0A0F0CTC1_9BACT|nr:polysaccharide biosynthesis protein [Candidatus Omnitrophus magneticus]